MRTDYDNYMEKVAEAYYRFNYNFLTHDEIYIYPEYIRDLKVILGFIETYAEKDFPENSW